MRQQDMRETLRYEHHQVVPASMKICQSYLLVVAVGMDNWPLPMYNLMSPLRNSSMVLKGDERECECRRPEVRTVSSRGPGQRCPPGAT